MCVKCEIPRKDFVLEEFMNNFSDRGFITYIGYHHSSTDGLTHILMFVKREGKLPDIPKNYKVFPIDVYRIEKTSKRRKRRKRKVVKEPETLFQQ